MKIYSSLPLAILVLTLFSACSKQERIPPPTTDTSKISAGPMKEGQGKGIVRGIDTGAKAITLEHGTVPGVMDAMTMDYHMDRPEMLSNLKIGDSVAFTLQDRGQGDFVVSQIAPIKK